MNKINILSTVGELVKEAPVRSRILEKYGIDYCCGGKVSLADACAKHGLDPNEIVQAMEDADADSGGDLVDPDAMSLTELADHIVATHHHYLRNELPRLDAMTVRVAKVHGADEPRLKEIRTVFQSFMAELASHMEKEENILFPIIRKMESGQNMQVFHCGSIAQPIRQMEAEHDNAGNALEQFRLLTDGYRPPDWACNTFRALYDALERLELDMHQHVHKENNVLFPKALSLSMGKAVV